MTFIIDFLEKYSVDPSETWPTDTGNPGYHCQKIWSNSESTAKTAFSEALGRQNVGDDFSTRFSSITRERNMLQTSKLSQKNCFVILHRLVYKLSRKVLYLKSEIVEIGRYWAIFRVFLDFLRFGRYELEAGHDDCARSDGRGLNIARGDGWGLPK